ncbi:MAG: glucosaminidase domain-containing protein [Paludibacteraceae bacterium]|nr:glucosaminidase domain-containing protein [Paludibacteraceae bacterium]
MNRLGLTLLLGLLSLSLFGQSYKSAETTAYIQKYHKTAIREMYKYKIPASITLAQGILESASGRSDLAIKANNHFGIKCSGNYNGKTYHKNDDKRHECFRVYSHADESFRDHSIFLTKDRYAALFKLKTTDYKGWAKGLKNAGYATNPKYPSLLIEIIEQNQLYEYDKNPDKYLSEKESENYSINGNETPAPKNDSNQNSTPVVKHGKINGVKCVQIKAGDTFYKLSKELGMSVEELQAINDFPANYNLKVGEYIFIQPKQKKNKSVDHHIVRQGDTWLSISQQYGIQKEKLKKMNKAKGESIQVGKKVRLH